MSGTFSLFRLHFKLPYLMLALTEFSICIAAVYASYLIRFSGQNIAAVSSVDSPFISASLYSSLIPLSLAAVGLYQSGFRGGTIGIVVRTCLGVLIGTCLFIFILYLVPSLGIGRGILAISATIACLLICVLRITFSGCVERDLLKKKIIVLGAGERASSINRRLRRRVDRQGFSIVAYLKSEGCSISDEVDRALIVSGLQNKRLYQLCEELGVSEVVVAEDDRRSGLPIEHLLECRLQGINVLDILAFFEREQGKLPLTLLRPDWLVYSAGFGRGLLKNSLKRFFDLMLSVIVILLTSPVILFTCLAIKIEEGVNAPVFYSQKRVGYMGELFSVLKFRSMRTDAEKSGRAQWAVEGDERVTKVGNIIRKLRIDELPQMLNVMMGSMSFVGPRPERPEFVIELSESVLYYNERHSVKPGITGWAQVSYPYGASVADAIQKQEYDLYYMKNHSLFLDCLIVLQTVEVVLFGRGSR